MCVFAMMGTMRQHFQTFLRKKSAWFALNFVGLVLEGRLLIVALVSIPTWRRSPMGAVDVQMGSIYQGRVVLIVIAHVRLVMGGVRVSVSAAMFRMGSICQELLVYLATQLVRPLMVGMLTTASVVMSPMGSICLVLHVNLVIALVKLVMEERLLTV